MPDSQDRNNTNAALGVAAVSLGSAQRANAIARSQMHQANENLELYTEEAEAHSRTRKELDRVKKENEALKANADAALAKENETLKQRVKTLESESTEKNVTISRQKDLLRQWMISQTAFKNLFKKYGKLPDGRKFDDMSDAEKIEFVDKEKDNVEKTGEGIKTADVRAAVLGKGK